MTYQKKYISAWKLQLINCGACHSIYNYMAIIEYIQKTKRKLSISPFLVSFFGMLLIRLESKASEFPMQYCISQLKVSHLMEFLTVRCRRLDPHRTPKITKCFNILSIDCMTYFKNQKISNLWYSNNISKCLSMR